MSKTLAELLADAASDDNLEFSTPDGTKVKLADIKSFRGVVETERQGAERQRKEAERLATEAKTIFESLQAAQAEFAKNKEAETKPTKKSRWQDNPLYDELVGVIEETQKAANEARQQAIDLKKSLDNSQAIYSLERMRREWAETGVKPKGKKFEDAVKEVIASKELDDMGLPTLSKWMRRETEQDRMDAYAAEKIALAQKDWEKKQRASEVSKPGKFQTRKSAEAPIKKLDELTSDVIANDQEIQDIMEGKVIQ
jgi:hypothetical protein